MPHSEYLIWVILNIIVGSAITSRSNIQGILNMPFSVTAN